MTKLYLQRQLTAQYLKDKTNKLFSYNLREFNNSLTNLHKYKSCLVFCIFLIQCLLKVLLLLSLYAYMVGHISDMYEFWYLKNLYFTAIFNKQ